jgi:hypothetical protein
MSEIRGAKAPTGSLTPRSPAAHNTSQQAHLRVRDRYHVDKMDRIACNARVARFLISRAMRLEWEYNSSIWSIQGHWEALILPSRYKLSMTHSRTFSDACSSRNEG